MDLKIPYKNCTNQQEAFETVKGILTPDFISKFKVTPEFEYGDNKITAKGKGFDLDVVFGEEAAEVSLNLGLLFKAFKGQVLGAIEKKVSGIL